MNTYVSPFINPETSQERAPFDSQVMPPLIELATNPVTAAPPVDCGLNQVIVAVPRLRKYAFTLVGALGGPFGVASKLEAGGPCPTKFTAETRKT